MCGFFAFSTGLSSRAIADMFELSNLPQSLTDIQSLKFTPKSYIPTISQNSPNQLVMRYWSLIPRWWQKELSDLKFATFNARAEEIATKASYRSSWKNNQRCLIPATWFYEFETKKVDGQVVKLPYRVELANQEILTMAGLYETWQSPQGETIDGVTIITTEAVGLLGDIDHRQPVIIVEQDREKWLNRAVESDHIAQLLQASSSLKVSRIDQSFNKAFGKLVTPDMVEPVST